MGFSYSFGSGKGAKKQAKIALGNAQREESLQSDIEFRRQLISNIRQERIARAQLSSYNYSDSFSSSSAAGATANLDSSLAGEVYYSYDTSARAQRIQDYYDKYQQKMEEYQKAQKNRAMSMAITGGVLGAVAGGGLAAAGMLAGTGVSAGTAIMTGAQIGQGIGQMAANTGMSNTMQGFQNILAGGTQLWKANDIYNTNQDFIQALTGGGLRGYELQSVNPNTNMLIPGTTINAGVYQAAIRFLGKDVRI